MARWAGDIVAVGTGSATPVLSTISTREYSMLMFYIPAIFLDGILSIFEANGPFWSEQMPARKAREPTIILME
jgi:hypothetical protein